MNKLGKIFFLMVVFPLFLSCASSDDNENENKENNTYVEKTDSGSENKTGDENGQNSGYDTNTSSVLVTFENRSIYPVSVYLDNPKYNRNAIPFVEVDANSLSTKNYGKTVKDAVTFFFVYSLDNFGNTKYPFIPQDSTYDHKTQRLSENSATRIIIDDIESFKTDSAFLILKNETTSSIYFISDTVPRIPYGKEYKEVNAGESVFYEIDGSNFSFEAASRAKIVKNAADSVDLPKIEYESGKVYTIIVAKDAISLKKTTYFPTSGNLCHLEFENKNQNDGSKTKETIIIEENQYLEYEDLPVPESRAGYEFAGWYADNQKIESRIQITQNLTLTAKWIPIEYSIEYVLNGGRNASENPASYTVEGETLILSEPTRTGYTFDGWYVTPDFTDKAFVSILKGSTGNKRLYAKWNTKIYTSDNLSELDLSLISEEYTVILSGYINETVLVLLADKIENAVTDINLDLSAATGITEIKGSAKSLFKNCAHLKNIVLPDCLEVLGDYAFYECQNLESVKLPENLKTLGNCVFTGCVNLKGVSIPNGVTSLGYMTFYRCSSLSAITIPDSVTKISSNSFKYCENLKNIYFDDGSEWYYGSYYGSGIKISLSYSSLNAIYFTSTYVDKYWYKK